MTRKHYVAIALIIKQARSQPTKINLTWAAQQLAYLFEQDNPRFDRDRFLTACGIK
jgi:hypothetical protein